MVLPSALGAAIAASAAVLKAKCTFLVGASECGSKCNGGRKQDPWAPKVDLRDDAEKRKCAQRKLEAVEEEKAAKVNSLSAAAQVQHERAMMCEQLHSFSIHSEPASNTPQIAPIQPIKGDLTYRRLADDQLCIHGAHRGLHSTGSVFVSSVDMSNASIFFMGGSAPFKALLVTEMSVTPAWFKELS